MKYDRRRVDPTVAHFEAARAADVAAARVADVVDLIERLVLDESGSRPRARRQLQEIADAATEASRALSGSADDWWTVRSQALTYLTQSGRQWPRLFTLANHK